VPNERISVLFPDPREAKNLGGENDGPIAHAPIIGAGTGVAVGSVLGWMVGIAALAVPGVGLFFAAGPILAVLGSATIGATIGAIAGGLVGLGIPEVQAKYYESQIRAGKFLIWVEVRDAYQIARITDLFTRYNASDIALSAAAAGMTNRKSTSSLLLPVRAK